MPCGITQRVPGALVVGATSAVARRNVQQRLQRIVWVSQFIINPFEERHIEERGGALLLQENVL